MESSSCMVIKVKYADTLRRFNSQVVGEELDLTVDGLRKKILSLFSFAPDTELTLTYIDEDGDVVGLVDDDDIHDVVMQALNPLRITVTLDAKKHGRKYNRASGSSTPLRSPRVLDPLQHLNSGVSEILRTIPGHLREALLKFLSDVASKGSLSAPGITELVDSFAKVGLSYLVLPPDSRPRVQADIPESTTTVAKTKNPRESDNKVLPNTRCGKCSPESNETLKNLLPEAITENNEVKLGDVNGGNKEVSSSKAFDHDFVAKALESQKSSFGPPVSDSLQTSSCLGKKEKVKEVINSNGMSHLPNSAESSDVPSIANDIGTKLDVNKPSDPKHGPIPADAIAPKVDPLRKKYRETDGSGSVFHLGIQCDGCGAHPITGTRFKSKVKVDYDLCSICFDEIGNGCDYIRMDFPVAFRSFRKGLSDDATRLRKVFKRCKVKTGSSKLDSLFIRDVSIVEGTVMTPSTPFTKILRMKNTGTAAWPQKTQLVWIGGAKLSKTLSVEVEIPATGLSIGQKIDVAVDLVTPGLPGKYISYWSMASPSGEKFGRRIGIRIKVDASAEKLPRESIRDWNLNLPPITSPKFTNIDPQPLVGNNQPEPGNSKKTVETVKPVAYSQLNTEQEMKFPISDNPLVRDPASVSYPVIDPSDLFPPLYSVPTPCYYPTAPPQQPLARDSHCPLPPPPPRPLSWDAPYPLPPPPPRGFNFSCPEAQSEGRLLRELKEIGGFKQVDPNNEILGMPGFDFEQYLADDVANWDHSLWCQK